MTAKLPRMSQRVSTLRAVDVALGDMRSLDKPLSRPFDFLVDQRRLESDIAMVKTTIYSRVGKLMWMKH